MGLAWQRNSGPAGSAVGVGSRWSADRRDSLQRASLRGILPSWSQLQVNIGDLYWQTSWPLDCRSAIAPHIYAPPTFAANRDPAMEAILDAIGTQDG